MMSAQSIEPVRIELTVNASQEKAFKTFTERIGDWWSREHHIGSAPMTGDFIEGRVGGRWYSSHEDGTESDTGKVLAWEPHDRLVLSWQITQDWKYDPDFVTEVEVNFIAAGEDKTIVKFEHRNLERYGDSAAELRQNISADHGWPMILGRFADSAAE